MHIDLRVLATATTVLVALGAGAEARTIYVSNEQGNSISIVDGDKLELVKQVEVGERPRGIVLSPDGKFLYICRKRRRHGADPGHREPGDRRRPAVGARTPR